MVIFVIISAASSNKLYKQPSKLSTLMEQKIVARIIVEVMGSPKDYVEETLKAVIAKLKEEKGIRLHNSKTYETEQLENKFWSTFAEIELDTVNLKRFIGLCIDYLPSSVEILEPAGMDIDLSEISNITNDMLAKLHEYSKIVKNLQAEILYMRQEKGVELSD